MALVLLTQYFDTLRDIGTRGGTNTIFLPNNPGAANDFQTQILAGLRGGTAGRFVRRGRAGMPGVGLDRCPW